MVSKQILNSTVKWSPLLKKKCWNCWLYVIWRSEVVITGAHDHTLFACLFVMLLPNDNGEEVIIFISWTLPDSKHRLCQAYYNWLVSCLWKAKESKSAKDGTRNAVWPGWRQALAGKWILNVGDSLLNMFCVGISHWTKERREIRPRDEGEGTHFKLSGKCCSRPGYRRVSAALFAVERTLTHLYTSLDLVRRPCCRK